MISLASIRLSCVIMVRLLRPFPSRRVLFKLHGALVGVRNNTFQLPWVTALLCQIAHSVLRGMAGSTGERAFHFSSLSLLRNVVHRDGNNHSDCNTRLIPLSRFSRGELWCHDPVAGEVLYPGTALYGTLHALAPPCLEFNASELHGTFPWIGDRVVLAAYHMKTPSSLNAARHSSCDMWVFGCLQSE